MAKKVTEFTVDRAKWITGDLQNHGDSALRNDMGMQCCLGFLARKCGSSVADIRGMSLPLGDVRDRIADRATVCMETIESAANLNDEPSTMRRTKETQLKALFAKHGITIKFTGRSPK